MMLDLSTLAVSAAALFVFAGQWSAASDANRINAANFRAGQRAWVGLEIKDNSEPFIVGNIGRNSTATFHIKNYGNSPAKRFLLHGTIFIVRNKPNWVDIQHDIENLPVGKDGSQEGTLFNGETTVNSTRADPETDFLEAQAIELGNVLYIAAARITYEDIFSDSHETTLCLEYVPPSPSDNPDPNRGHWQGCPIHEKAT